MIATIIVVMYRNGTTWKDKAALSESSYFMPSFIDTAQL